MKPKVVFFGGADYGKSTIIGYMYAKSHGINMKDVEKELKEKVGSDYKSDYLYSYLVNPHAVKSIKDPKYGRASNVSHSIKNASFDDLGVELTLIDTAGQLEFLNSRQQGMSMSDIGVCCLAINKVLSDDFKDVMTEYAELYEQYHTNGKLIYLLTMFDLVNYNKNKYDIACKKITEHCRSVSVPHTENTDLGELRTARIEPDTAAIIPVSIDFKSDEKGSVNIFSLSEKTLWYQDRSLVRAIQNQASEILTTV